MTVVTTTVTPHVGKYSVSQVKKVESGKDWVAVIRDSKP